ncbi:unnamed protein product [Bemisia tabaci]|uniref:Uncharacterized protein n=1 Tax=Bemisia tabaci TaxID=7038 RepID=A0A9P0AHZ7_BEMTA|nr:unnamed protein product [Bemisia tabaci]
MSYLTIEDILLIFNAYEPSRVLTWEIVRTLHPIHTAALIYLLENVGKTNKLNAFDPIELPFKQERTGESRAVITPRYNFAQSVTIKLTRVMKTTDNLPDLNELGKIRMASATDTHDQNGKLTIIGLLRMITDELYVSASQTEESNDTSVTATRGIFNSLNLNERIAAHNLSTNDYGRFLANIVNHLLPDEMHRDRNRVARLEEEPSITRKFLKFYESMSSLNKSHSRYCRNVDPNSFRCTLRPNNVILTQPIDANNLRKYMAEPYYSGIRVVINSTRTETRCYNRYGEPIPGFLHGERFESHATFEAVVLPLDRTGALRSWRYNPRPKWSKGAKPRTRRHTKIEKPDFVLKVVDVFRFEDGVLYDTPFEKRVDFIERIGGRLIQCSSYSQDQAHLEMLERDHRSSLDPFHPITGIMYRRCDSSYDEKPLIFKFRPIHYYDFFSNEFVSPTLSADKVSVIGKPLSNIHGILIDPEIVAEYRTVCIVYAHDKECYFVCKFDRDLFHFKHAGTLLRGTDISRKKPKYKRERIYVQNAKRIPMGIMLLRVYYNKEKGQMWWWEENEAHIKRDTENIEETFESSYSIVAYEDKITLSMYDVPHDDQLFKN